MSVEQFSEQLKKHIPEDATDIVAGWIIQYKITLRITNSRKSVFGDYRWPQKGKGHRISVNGDLNSFAFLITLVHEIAHLTTWEKFRNTVSSHGKEWKQEFKNLMDEFSGRKIFPADVRLAFKEHLLSPTFSHCVDEKLMKILRKYDKSPATLLEEVNAGSLFKCNKRIYRKGEKIRKRFKCIEVKTGKAFLFSPIAEIETL